MRRIAIALTSTLVGVVLLFSYYTSRPGSQHQEGAASGGFDPNGVAASDQSATTASPSSSAWSASGSLPARTPSAKATASSSAKATKGSTPSKTAPSTATRTTSQVPLPPAVPPATTSQPAAPAKPSGTFTGTAADTRFGPVQVQITVSNGSLTAAKAVQYPWSNRKDQEINSYALPILNRESVAAQSANIDSVSGATYTSEGYKQSLQSALDQARL